MVISGILHCISFKIYNMHYIMLKQHILTIIIGIRSLKRSSVVGIAIVLCAEKHLVYLLLYSSINIYIFLPSSHNIYFLFCTFNIYFFVFLGAPFVTWTNIPSNGFNITKGNLKYYQATPKGKRGFCSDCGSQLVFQSTSSLSIHLLSLSLHLCLVSFSVSSPSLPHLVIIL